MISTDVYSVVNPALGSLILWSFVKAYETETVNGCEFPVLFLPFPICLSKSIRDEFSGSNSQTGLLAWTNRKPQVLIDLPTYIQRTESFTRESMIFATTNGLLRFAGNGSIVSDSQGLKKRPTWKTSEELGHMIQVSTMFGKWCGQLNSTELILNGLGVSI